MGLKEQLAEALQNAVEKGHWDKAVEAIEGLLKLDPANPQYRLRLGDYHVKLNNRVRAIEEYYRAVEAYTQFGAAVKANAVCKMILRLDPTAEKALRALRPVETAVAVQDSTARIRAALGSTLCASMSQEQVAELAEQLQPPQTFPPGGVIVREGAVDKTLYLIIKGRVEVVTQRRGGTLRLAELGDGEFFGELSVLTGEPRTASVITMTETEALVIQGQDVVELLARYPSIKDVLIESGRRRMAETRDALKKRGW